MIIVMGVNTALGKTTIANGVAAFFESADLPVQKLRIETRARRREFAAKDLFIDLDLASDAANLVGGEAAVFDSAWPEIKRTVLGGGVVVIDCGAGAQHLFLKAADATGFDGLIAALNASCSVIVVTTPDAESGRQAARLVVNARERMSHATVMLAINHPNPAQRTGADTPSQRAFTQKVDSLNGIPQLDVPFARAHALTAFAEHGADILQVLRARDEQLMQWSKRGELASLAAQAHLAAWFRSLCDQLAKIFL